MKDSTIQNSQLNEITEKLDIVALISEYLSLKKTGKNFKALCPFHEEKTPSFIVNPEKQIFHCFGCGLGGNLFKFIMNIESLPFPEAVAFAARKAGVKITSRYYNPDHEKRKDALFAANSFAAAVYSKSLLGPQGVRALEYFTQRNISARHVKEFSLGFAPHARTFLAESVMRKKLDIQNFIRAGLISRDGKSDVFRNRIMFPIFTLGGDIAGFGGRSIDDERMPKYFNTAENLVFSKSRLLYGFNWAKEAVKESGFAVIVEGYFDVLKLHVNGMNNCLAPMGTSLTDAHLNLLRRFTDKVLLVFDSDTSGVQASLRNLETLLQKGFETKICLLPANFDPDKFIDDYGMAGFKKLMNSSLGFLDFAIKISSGTHDMNTPRGRSLVARTAIRLISLLPDRIEQQEYVKILSEKVGLKASVIESYIEPCAEEDTSRCEKQNGRGNVVAAASAENLLMAIMLSDSNYWHDLLSRKDKLSGRIGAVVDISKSLLSENVSLTPSNLINSLCPETGDWISGIAMNAQDMLPEGKKQQIFNDCVCKLHKMHLCERLDSVKKQIEEKKASGLSYSEEIQELQVLLVELKKE